MVFLFLSFVLLVYLRGISRGVNSNASPTSASSSGDRFANKAPMDLVVKKPVLLVRLRRFRNTHGAHAAAFENLLASHQALANSQQLIEEAAGYFLAICEVLVQREREIFPDFEARLEEFIKKHDLNETFRCIASSTPTIKEIIGPPPPPANPGQKMETVEFNGKKFALLRFR